MWREDVEGPNLNLMSPTLPDKDMRRVLCVGERLPQTGVWTGTTTIEAVKREGFSVIGVIERSLCGLTRIGSQKHAIIFEVLESNAIR